MGENRLEIEVRQQIVRWPAGRKSRSGGSRDLNAQLRVSPFPGSVVLVAVVTNQIDHHRGGQ